jgi:FtsH-binding integral membrane protein
METLRLVLLFLHIVGFASLFGGLFVQLRAQKRAVNNAMLHGVLTAVVTGLLLVGVLEGMDAAVDNAKIGAKSLVGLALAVLVFVNRKKPSLPNGLYLSLLGLTLLNIALAVFWAPAHA